MALANDPFVPTPIHRAIDQVTALRVQVQRLARRLESGAPVDPDVLDAHLQTELGVLNELVAILEACKQDLDPPRG